MAATTCLLTPRKYDVVTADIILPIHAGSNNIYSREYFSARPERAQAGRPRHAVGVWHRRRAQDHHADVSLGVSEHHALGRRHDHDRFDAAAHGLRRGDFEWKRQLPGRRQALDDLGAGTWEKLLALYVAGPEELRRYVGDGPILTDDRPLVEYFLSLPRDKTMDLTRRPRRRAADCRALTYAFESLSARRSTLPTMFFGRSARNSTDTGTL